MDSLESSLVEDRWCTMLQPSTHQSHALPNRAASSSRYFLSVSSNPFFSAQSMSTWEV